jgi:hypothetical protein
MNAKMQEAIQAARRNSGVLKRAFDTTWSGLKEEELKVRFPSELIAAMVKAGYASYTKFKDGSKRAGIEVTLTP